VDSVVWLSGQLRKAFCNVSVSPLIDSDLVVRRLVVRARDVVFVKGIFEASEGLCAMFAESGGELLIAAAPTRAEELDELLQDLETELGAVLETVPKS
jgi:hypothetical protein